MHWQGARIKNACIISHSQVVALLLPLVQHHLSNTFSAQRPQWGEGQGHMHQAELLGQNLAQDQHHSAEGYGEIVLRKFLLSIDTLAGQVHGQEAVGDLQWY